MPQCKNSVETKTGVFTAYHGKFSKCEAENRCMKMGQILAPITNRRDASKLLMLARKNDNSPCTHSDDHEFRDGYWVGLDVTYNEEYKKYERVFSNGVEWDEGKHDRIYKNHLEDDTFNANPVALFTPLNPNNKFATFYGAGNCGSLPDVYSYICLKPRSEMSSVRNGRGLPGDETMMAEAVVQRNDGIFVTFNVAAVAVSIAAFCVGVAVRARRKSRKLEMENEAKRNKEFGGDEMRIDGKEANI